MTASTKTYRASTLTDALAQVRAELGHVRRSSDVDGGRLLRLPLGEVDVRPGGGVQNEIGRLELRRRRALDVPVPKSECKGVRKLLRQRAAELPGRAGDQDSLSRSDRIGDVVRQRLRTRGSSHAMPRSVSGE